MAHGRHRDAPVAEHRQLRSDVLAQRLYSNAAALIVLLVGLRGGSALAATLRKGGTAFWLSGVCWAVMFTAFMVAITMTRVANVLVTMAAAPLLTALVARVVLGHRLPRRTWSAVLIAGIGIVLMYVHEVSGASPRQLAGMAVAVGVPVAAAINWTVIQKSGATAATCCPPC